MQVKTNELRQYFSTQDIKYIWTGKTLHSMPVCTLGMLTSHQSDRHVNTCRCLRAQSIPSMIFISMTVIHSSWGWDASQGEQTVVKWSVPPLLSSIFHGFFISESSIAMPSRPSAPAFLIKIEKCAITLETLG